MTNTINKVIRNGTEYEFNAVNWWVTSVNTRTWAVTWLAEDNAVVKLTWDQTIAGTKTFSTSPVVPSKTSDAANTWTAIATEAQVYKKANTSDVLTKTNTTSYTPSADYHPATKKYVDDNIKTYNAWTWIAIWNDYSAMQWPAPDGFHVPLATEWKAVHNVWKALGWGASDWTNFWIALKLPFAGRRMDSSSSVSSQGSYGNYWLSSRYSTKSAFFLYFGSATISPQDSEYRANGFSVRCFKNSATIPTSSWTKLYWTSIEAWGIFWSSTDWLISMSGDWSTWITIADKNLWATTAWNSWDTLSEANCGKYYQWGNNYWFDWTWTLTNTSTTQVDASSYWPWNYYNSNVFIKYSWRRDSTDNWNLWWWVTWIIDNAISNTGVLSVNWDTGDVIVDTSEVSWVTTEQPSDPVAGSTYYDTTNNVLMVYDWSAWWAVWWSDYSWVTKTISSWQVELWLRTIVNHPGSNFTLTAPATLKEWEEYVIRTISEASYTMTLWTWFTNPRNVDLTLSQYATDQFAFLAVWGDLELQPLVATWS